MSRMEPNVDPTVQWLRVVRLKEGVTTTRLAVMVRETEVSPAIMKINAMAKHLMSQSTALYVPAFGPNI